MVLISDVLAHREINAFSSFIRDDTAVSSQLADSTYNATVLAPLNAAMAKLPHKPWESPEEYSSGGPHVYSGSDGAKRAEENLRRFVAAHIVPKSPWESGDKIKTLAGKEVWWELKDGKQIVQPDGVVVQSVVQKAANGELWSIDGVLKP